MPSEELIQQGERRREQMREFIEDFWREHGYSPSIIEIGEAVGILSPNSVRSHLQRMVLDGVIKMDAGVSRSIRLVDYEMVRRS